MSTRNAKLKKNKFSFLMPYIYKFFPGTIEFLNRNYVHSKADFSANGLAGFKFLGNKIFFF